MRAYFNLDANDFPVTVEHIGAEWPQDQIIRYQGFPHFHWLQTEKGVGNFGLAKAPNFAGKGGGTSIARCSSSVRIS